jgi:hypothetical protein
LHDLYVAPYVKALSFYPLGCDFQFSSTSLFLKYILVNGLYILFVRTYKNNKCTVESNIAMSKVLLFLFSGILALNGFPIPSDVYAWSVVFILPINSALNPFLYTVTAIIGKKVKQWVAFLET